MSLHYRNIKVLAGCLAVFSLCVFCGIEPRHSAVFVSQTDRVIWPQAGRVRKRTSDLYRCPHCSRLVDPLTACSVGAKSTSAFSLWSTRPPVYLYTVYTHTKTQTHTLSPSSPALFFQLKPARHAVGDWDSAVIMEVVVECPLFHCSAIVPCLIQGWTTLVHSAVTNTSYKGPGSG